MENKHLSELKQLTNNETLNCLVSHPASTDQELDFLGSEQVFKRRLVGDHVEASPESFELLLHTFVQHVLRILSHKLLHRHINRDSYWLMSKS